MLLSPSLAQDGAEVSTAWLVLGAHVLMGPPIPTQSNFSVNLFDTSVRLLGQGTLQVEEKSLLPCSWCSGQHLHREDIPPSAAAAPELLGLR